MALALGSGRGRTGKALKEMVNKNQNMVSVKGQCRNDTGDRKKSNLCCIIVGSLAKLLPLSK